MREGFRPWPLAIGRILSLQNFDKLVDTHYVNVRKWYLFENVIVMIFCHDITRIGFKGTIYEFVIVWVGSNEVKMKVHLLSRTTFIAAYMAYACVQTSTPPSRCR